MYDHSISSLKSKAFCEKNIACQKITEKRSMPEKIKTFMFPSLHTKPHNMNMNAHYDLQEHCEALFPYSTQRGVAKFVDSAQLNPWLNPAWYPYGNVIMISPASWVIWSTTKKRESWQHFSNSTKQITNTWLKWIVDLYCGKHLSYFSSANIWHTLLQTNISSLNTNT